MCTFNGGRFLEEQLKSIAAQTRLPDEVVVCDDQSSDETVAIIQGFAASAPFRLNLTANANTFGVVKNFEQAITTVRLLAERIDHLEMRVGLPQSRLRRAPLVLRELVSGRYHLYSNGAASAAKDLFFEK